jgi:hypothetical protein
MLVSEEKIFIVNFKTVNKEDKKVEIKGFNQYNAEVKALELFRNEQPNRLAYSAVLKSAQTKLF